MKKSIFKIALFSLIAIAAASCVAETSPYQPAEPATGEQIYFPKTISEKIVLTNNQTSFDIPVLRNATALEAIDVAIEASGNGLDVFEVPGTFSFQSGEKESKITVEFDPADLTPNTFYDLTIKISDDGLTTPYGTSTLAFTAGINLPWLVFDEGVLSEAPDWWEEQENKILYYQQISENIRFCRVPECFGYETIKGGKPYDVQDYTFYWNTETNQIYIPKQYMGNTNSNGPTFFLDESEFYNWYWDGYGYAPGTDEWFAFCDNFRAKYPGDYYPYYDGNGGFFLADHYSAGEPGTASFLGFYVQAGTPDSFICNSFVRKDFTSSVEYGGMFVDPDGNATPIINFGGTEDVAGLKYIIAGQDIDPLTLLSVVVVGEDENIQDVTLEGGKASVQHDLEVGIYRIVAVPYDADGALQPGDAVMCDFYFPGANADKPEVEAELMLMSGTEVFSEEMIKQYGMTDYNSLGYVLYGKEIKSGKYYCNEASVIATWTDPLEDLVAAYGSDLDAEDISTINSKGYTAGGWINRKASTEYQMIVVLENVYGSKLTLTASHTTAALPYQGELVIGEYTIDCSHPAYGTITVTPTEDETKFIVYDIAIPNGAGWNAVYDSAKHTLTCDGTENGYEEDGNQFGELYGYWDNARTQAYAIDVYSSDDSDYKEPIVFDVDPTTHQLTKIHPNVDLDVFSLEDGSYVGTANSIEDGATVTYVPTNNAVRTVNKASVNKAYRSLKGARFSTVSEFNAETRAFKPLPSSSKEWSTGSMKVKGNSKKNFEVSKVVEKF